jgi:hypothetical protein
MFLLLNDDGVISALEHVSGPDMPFVEGNAVSAVEAFHPACQVRLGRFDEEVVVVGHEAEGVAEPSILPDCLL